MVVSFIIDVLQLNVRFVVVAKFRAPVIFRVLAQSVIVRTFELLLTNCDILTVTQLVSSVQLVTVIGLVIVNASCIVHHPPDQSNVTLTHTSIQFVVIVFHVDVDLKVKVVALYVLVIPAVHPDRFILPYIFNADVHAHVTFHTKGHHIVKFAQSAVVFTVTVYAVAFESVSKMTSSVVVGKFQAHGAPPLVVAQWFVASDQFHVPPTQ